MKKLRLLGAVSACLIAACLSTSTSAAVTAYAQDFESMTPGLGYPPNDLSTDGWLVWGDVWTGGVGTNTFQYSYGPFQAPDGTPGFSAVAGGEGGVNQGAQYLNIYSDYNNPDQTAFGLCGLNGCTINTSVFQEQTIDAGDIGSIWTLTFDAKSPFSGGIFDGTQQQDNGGLFQGFPQSASAFIKTIDPLNNFSVTNDIRVDMTEISNIDWATFSISLDLSNPLLEGQLLQFGFNTIGTEYQASGVYYDNINFRPVPVPAALWLFGSGLIGLIGIARRKAA